MNISAKIEYACIAVLELAVNYNSGKPVRIRAIAQTHGIPSRFLVQILLQLKGANLVSSTRGAFPCDRQRVRCAKLLPTVRADSPECSLIWNSAPTVAPIAS